jgi:hypothetical protein
MFHEIVDGSGSPDGTGAHGEPIESTALLAAFETLLAEAVADAGSDRIVEMASLDAATVEAAETVVAELRDHLLMGMTTAVLDVDTIAATIDADLTGQEVQQTLEGRAAMTLGQLAEIMAVIEANKR